MTNFIGEYDRYLIDPNGTAYITFKAKKLDINTIPKEKLKIEITVYKEKRSLNANNYFWQLCDKIAEKLLTSAQEVYRNFIKEQNIFKRIEINKEAVSTFIAAWSSHGSGWLCEKTDYSDKQDFAVIHAYYGSSVYNKAQMSGLIDSAISQCKELGIETITPAEKALMLERYEAAKL